jgi:hypothetical protein
MSYADQLAALVDNHIRFSIQAVREDGGPKSPRNLEADSEYISYVRGELADGNIWPWCVVTVYAELGDWFATSERGALSFQSQGQFEKSDTYQEMKLEAVESLLTYLKESDENS